jgi:hypothetical protein
MDSRKINWLSIGTNVGVIGGLILVALQLNQNSELLRLQMIDQESRRMTDHEVEYMGELGAQTWAKMIENPEELSVAEQRVAESLIWPPFETWRNAYNLYEAGLLGSEWRDRVLAEVPYILGHIYGRAWWANLKEIAVPGEIPEPLRTLIDDVVDSSSDYPKNYHRGIMDRVKDAVENDA